MTGRFERVVSVVITSCAVIIASSVAYRSVFPAAPREVTRAPERVPSWKEALAVGRVVGNLRAPVTIVEFADFQCPVCRSFHSTVQSVLKQYPEDVAFVQVHYPLNYHKLAMPAARAAECAADRGRFEQWLDVAYRNQDSLGIKSWGAMALEAGVADSAAVAKCARDTVRVDRIQAGLALGEKIGVDGTPTVIVNGWRLPSAPQIDRLKDVVESIKRGEDPFEKRRWTAKANR